MAHGTFSGKTGNQNSPKAFGESKKPDKMVCLGWHVPICKYYALHGKANWPTSGDGATDKFISNFLKIPPAILHLLIKKLNVFLCRHKIDQLQVIIMYNVVDCSGGPFQELLMYSSL